jgi:hypothetical protein
LGFSSLGLWAMASGAARSAARVQEQRCRIIAWEGLLGVLRSLEKYSGWCSRELGAGSWERLALCSFRVQLYSK